MEIKMTWSDSLKVREFFNQLKCQEQKSDIEDFVQEVTGWNMLHNVAKADAAKEVFSRGGYGLIRAQVDDLIQYWEDEESEYR